MEDLSRSTQIIQEAREKATFLCQLSDKQIAWVFVRLPFGVWFSAQRREGEQPLCVPTKLPSIESIAMDFLFYFIFLLHKGFSQSAFDLPSRGFTASQFLPSRSFDKSIQSLWFPFCWACWKPVGRNDLLENELLISAHVTLISHGSSRLPTLLWAVEGRPGKPGPQVGRGTGGLSLIHI